MASFLKRGYCIEDKGICMDEKMDEVELAVLWQLLGKFQSRCGSISESLKVNELRAAVEDAALQAMREG